MWQVDHVAKDVLDDCPDLIAQASLWRICNVCRKKGNISVCNLGLHPARLPNVKAATRRQHEDALRQVGHNTAWCLAPETGKSLCCVSFTVDCSFSLHVPYAVSLICFATLSNFFGVFYVH
jgi:hypothetical protein